MSRRQFTFVRYLCIVPKADSLLNLYSPLAKTPSLNNLDEGDGCKDAKIRELERMVQVLKERLSGMEIIYEALVQNICTVQLYTTRPGPV